MHRRGFRGVAAVAAAVMVPIACGSTSSSIDFASSPAPTVASPPAPAVATPVMEAGRPELPSAQVPQVVGIAGSAPSPSLQAELELGTGPDHVVGLIDNEGATLVGHAVVDQVVAYAEPGSDTVVARLDNPTNHGGPLVFQAMTQPDSTQIDFGWIEVLLPVRPNGTTGWIRTGDVDLSVNPYRIEVDVDDFTLTVFRHNAPYLTTPVGIGRGETPTPEGSFYLAELLRPSDPDGIYGPYAYGLSGFSETLDSFAGGEAVIGVHGTNEPWAIGTTVSHGCIRVDNAMIEALATFLPLGTPVEIGI